MSNSVLATTTTAYDAYADFDLSSITTLYGERLYNFLKLKKFFDADHDAEDYFAYVQAVTESSNAHEDQVKQLRTHFHRHQPTAKFNHKDSLVTSHLADEMCQLLHTTAQGYPSGGTIPRSLLDVGCGSGIITSTVARHFGIARSKAVGLDIFPPKAVAGNITFRRILRDDIIDATNGQKFDVVVLSMVLHHSASPERMLREAAAAVGQGGYLLLKEHDAPKQLHDFLDAIHFFHEQIFPDKTLYLPNERNYKSLEQWQKLTEALGFEVASIAYDRYENRPANTGNNFTLLLRKVS